MSESESDWSETSGIVESDADRIRRNDKSLTRLFIGHRANDIIETLDALKNSTVVKCLKTAQLDEEALVKLSEVMKRNKSVTLLRILLDGEELLREKLFAAMAASGGWLSIQELHLKAYGGTINEAMLSITELEHITTFILQSENLRTLCLDQTTEDEAESIVDTLSRTNTNVQSLTILLEYPVSVQRGGRQFATVLGRCTCITKLRLKLGFYDHVDLKFFQFLLVESIPTMLGLKKLEIEIRDQFTLQGFDVMMGQCIELHQGEIEKLTIDMRSPSVNMSIVGLAPALRRLKVIKLYGLKLTPQQIGELSGIAADCDTLEEFGCNLYQVSTHDFKALCQFLSTFPSLKRVIQQLHREVDLREEDRFTAFLEMVKSSKTIEEVPSFLFRNAEKEAAIQHHCRNNMIHNRIREKGLLSANVPASAWPLILGEFSDMTDVLYYLLQQKNGAMIGPTRHG